MSVKLQKTRRVPQMLDEPPTEKQTKNHQSTGHRKFHKLRSAELWSFGIYLGETTELHTLHPFLTMYVQGQSC